MSLQTWQETLIWSQTDGPTLTAAAAASALLPEQKITLPANWWYVGRVLKITAQGRISCVATPGTARFDVQVSTASIVIFDTGALNLNTAGKTNVPWWFECVMTCRAVGNATSANVMGLAWFQSEAVVGAVANNLGGNGSLLCPVGTPAVGNGFNSTLASVLDFRFTQTVATGSMTVHEYKVESLN